MATTRGVGVWTASGLFMLCMKAWALSCKTATCVHDSDAMRSSRVLDRCQLDPILFEVYMTSARHATRARHAQIYCVLAWCRELCDERLGSVRYIYRAALVSRSTLVEPSVGPREAPRANHPQHARTPFKDENK